jgi:hypothetical protein
MPTLPNTFFNGPPHSGHTVSASSENAWTISNWWSQFLQRYS